MQFNFDMKIYYLFSLKQKNDYSKIEVWKKLADTWNMSNWEFLSKGSIILKEYEEFN